MPLAVIYLDELCDAAPGPGLRYQAQKVGQTPRHSLLRQTSNCVAVSSNVLEAAESEIRREGEKEARDFLFATFLATHHPNFPGESKSSKLSNAVAMAPKSNILSFAHPGDNG